MKYGKAAADGFAIFLQLPITDIGSESANGKS